MANSYETGRSERARLVKFNIEKIEHGYLQAVQAGEERPVMLVVDLRDKMGFELASRLAPENVKKVRDECNERLPRDNAGIVARVYRETPARKMITTARPRGGPGGKTEMRPPLVLIMQGAAALKPLRAHGTLLTVTHNGVRRSYIAPGIFDPQMCVQRFVPLGFAQQS